MLQGLKQTLLRYKPIVYWEFETRLGATAFGPLPFLESLGYACVPNERAHHKSGVMPCKSGICDVTCSMSLSRGSMISYLEGWIQTNGRSKRIHPRYGATRRKDGRTVSAAEQASLAKNQAA